MAQLFLNVFWHIRKIYNQTAKDENIFTGFKFECMKNVQYVCMFAYMYECMKMPIFLFADALNRQRHVFKSVFLMVLGEKGRNHTDIFSFLLVHSSDRVPYSSLCFTPQIFTKLTVDSIALVHLSEAKWNNH